MTGNPKKQMDKEEEYRRIAEEMCEWMDMFYDAPSNREAGEVQDDGSILTQEEADALNAADELWRNSLESKIMREEGRRKTIEDTIRELREQDEQTDRMKMTTKSKMRVVGGRKRR